jgi:hypothetical protein
MPNHFEFRLNVRAEAVVAGASGNPGKLPTVSRREQPPPWVQINDA